MAENKKGLGDQFKEALSYIGPRLFAQLIGGNDAMNTTDQMLRGIEQSQRANNEAQRQRVNDDFDRRMKMANFNLRKDQAEKGDSRTRFQQTQGLRDEQGRPLTFDPATGKTLDIEGKVYTGKFVDPISGRSGRGLAFKKEKFAHDKAKSAQLSDSQSLRDEGFRGTEEILGKLSEFSGNIKSKIGPASGRASSLALALGKDSPDVQYFQTLSEAFIQQYARTKQGGRLTDQDLEFNRKILPNMNDTYVNLQAKVKAVQDMIEMEKRAFAESIETGQPLKAKAIQRFKRGLIQELDEAAKTAPKQETQQSGSIRVKTPSGKTRVISIEQAKKMGII